MKATLKYPIFQFSPDENMVYTFWKENKTTQLALLKECKGWKGDIVIDSTGTKYTVRRSYMTGWKGIHGFTGMRTGMIRCETEYENNPEPFSLRQLQERIAERYPKGWWFEEECWDSVDDFRQTIFACKSFEELAETMEPKHEFTVWERIQDYFFRGFFLMLGGMLLYIIWMFIKKAWLWIVG
ncbi:hypothetical protein [Bacteroides congonensis]|jgi:hypothetical protein|uniref:hypothetical protein n=1 Tax=Bacteroides congonensis TaxID=1871006 RepID=UPI0009348552|nr:hypothetical protein [Bacteroides congonensis]